MSAGLSRLQGRKARRADIPLGSALLGLTALALVMFGAVAGVIMAVDEGDTADPVLAKLTLDRPGSQYEGDEDGSEPSRGFASMVPGMAGRWGADVGLASPPVASGGNPMDANASLAPVQSSRSSSALDPVALSGLRISSQSWRRGGLGSRALVTFTISNTHAFAIKDVEINCAFSRRDGSQVTERRRVVPGEVRPRSRKTFGAFHVGFVNVNVSTAKCALVAATKI